MRTFLLVALFLMPATVFCQTENDPASTMVQIDPMFEQYCLSNALSVIDVPAEKAKTLAVDGTLPALLDASATYRDYRVEPIEGRTQYFRIEGTDKVLAVKSLYTLRLNYSNAKK